jgi:hypothetical protein
MAWHLSPFTVKTPIPNSLTPALTPSHLLLNQVVLLVRSGTVLLQVKQSAATTGGDCGYFVKIAGFKFVHGCPSNGSSVGEDPLIW